MQRENYRFSEANRLRTARDFQRVYRQGKVLQGRYFKIFYLELESGGPPRLGLTAVRRLGGAVVRNRAKRVIREAFRLNKGLFSGLELIVQLRDGVSALSKGELREEFLRAARRLRLRLSQRQCGCNPPPPPLIS
ncbi:MAG: ribonuclease P protein component [Candidatus Bipolaricaulia bacterium]